MDQKQQLNDDIPIFVSISTEVSQCECCGRKNLKKTVRLDLPNMGTIYLGVTCASGWFDINMSGNPYYAADKLAKKLRTLANDEVNEIVENIKDSNQNV